MDGIGESEYAERVSRLRQGMAERGLDSFVVTDVASVHYLCRYGGGHLALREAEAGQNEVALILSQDEAILAVGSLSISKEESDSVGCQVVDKGRSVYDAAGRLLASMRCSKAGVEAKQLTVDKAKEMKRAFTAAEFVPSDDLILGMRQIKSAAEVVEIMQSLGCAEASFKQTMKSIGLTSSTERMVATELDRWMRLNGSDESAFPTRVMYGRSCGSPHVMPSDKLWEQGEMVMMDWGAVVNSYHSDISRTMTPDTKGAEEWDGMRCVIMDAMDTAERLAEPGMKCSDLYVSIRDRVKDRLNGGEFVSSLGHGVGLEPHEEPHMSKWSNDTFKVGQVVCIEPAIYVYGRGCMHIEDMYLMTEVGLKRLSTLLR